MQAMGRNLLGVVFACLLSGVAAFPPFFKPSVASDDNPSLNSTQVASFKPFTFYAAAAYCQPPATLTWTCGTNCDGNPHFQPMASGGDGGDVQFWFVGYDPSLHTVIVSHQGTDPLQIMAVLTDADIAQTNLDASLFPGISSAVKVHEGFAKAQLSSAAQILAAVQDAAGRFNATHVTLVGHSLGAAIALLDAVYLPLHMPDMTFSTVGYGLPRVGNQAFADYVDAQVTSLTRVNNKFDPVPTTPGKFLGFHHPSGEVRIQDTDQWEPCPGQDNSAEQCTTGAVPDILFGSVPDHLGPYDGIVIGSIFC